MFTPVRGILTEGTEGYMPWLQFIIYGLMNCQGCNLSHFLQSWWSLELRSKPDPTSVLFSINCRLQNYVANINFECALTLWFWQHAKPKSQSQQSKSLQQSSMDLRLIARVHLFIFKNYLRVESTAAAKTTLAVIIARWTLMTFEYELLQQLLQVYGYKVYKINFSCLWWLPP